MNSPQSSSSPTNSLSYSTNVVEDDHHHHERQEQNEQEKEEEINLASLYFTLVGIGYLFPFSALTQPVDYWHKLFPQFNIEFSLTTIYMYTNLLTLALLVFCGSTTTTTMTKTHFTKRIVGGFIGQLIVLILVPSSYFFTGTSERTNLIIVLGCTIIAASVTAFLDSSVIALNAQYPTRVQEMFQLGVGVSTLIGSLYRDLTKGVFPNDMIVASSLVYFYTGAATIGVCIGAYYKLMGLKLTQDTMKNIPNTDDATNDQDDNELISEKSHLLLQPATDDDTKNNETITKSITTGTTGTTPSSTTITKWTVLQKIWFNELMISLLFATTLALWPALVTEIPSYNFPSLQQSGWWSLLLLTLFSVMDCIGRILTKYRMGITSLNVWKPIVLRTVLCPCIYACVKGIIFHHDGWSIFFVGMLGFTNGYIGALAIMLINDLCTEVEQPIAGMFTSFFLNSGLVVGASAGLALGYLLI